MLLSLIFRVEHFFQRQPTKSTQLTFGSVNNQSIFYHKEFKGRHIFGSDVDDINDREIFFQ